VESVIDRAFRAFKIIAHNIYMQRPKRVLAEIWHSPKFGCIHGSYLTDRVLYRTTFQSANMR
jgi:hypothetical protein